MSEIKAQKMADLEKASAINDGDTSATGEI
jgi:hypothetical protein